MKKIILASIAALAVSLGAASQASAAICDAYGVCYVDSTISDVAMQVSGSNYFYVAGSLDLCTNAAGSRTMGVVTFSTAAGANNDAARNVLSTVLAAKLAGAKVRVFAKNPSSGAGCQVTTVELTP